jgi:fumarate reductase subunit D
MINKLIGALVVLIVAVVIPLWLAMRNLKRRKAQRERET